MSSEDLLLGTRISTYGLLNQSPLFTNRRGRDSSFRTGQR